MTLQNEMNDSISMVVRNSVWNSVWNSVSDSVSDSVNTKLSTYDFAKQNK